MTNHWNDIDNTSLVFVFGANPAENHPACMAHINAARFGTKKARLIVVDPRLTRTARQCDPGRKNLAGVSEPDFFVRIRPGTNVAFSNGLLSWIFTHISGDASTNMKAWHNGTNATVHLSLGRSFIDDAGTTQSLDGPALSTAKYNGVATAEALALAPGYPKYCDSRFKVNTAGDDYQRATLTAKTNTNFETDPAWRFPEFPVIAANVDDPDCVYQKLKAHVAPYTTAVVADICGCTETDIAKVAQALIDNSRFASGDFAAAFATPQASGYRATTILYAMGQTQHTNASQNIKDLAVIQTLMGNMGRPGGGINALRGIHNVQGSTDWGLLFDSIPGYSGNPQFEEYDHYSNTLFGNRVLVGANGSVAKNIELQASLGLQQAGFQNMTQEWFGNGAVPRADIRKLYDLWPKGDGVQHIKTFRYMAINDGDADDANRIKAAVIWGQNPAVTEPNQSAVRIGLKNLDLMVLVDMFETETAAVSRRDGAPTYLIPACSHVEEAGSVTNSGRWLQWRERAALPKGNSKADIELLLRFAYALDVAGAFSHIKALWDVPANVGWGMSTKSAYQVLYGDKYGWTPGQDFEAVQVTDADMWHAGALAPVNNVTVKGSEAVCELIYREFARPLAHNANGTANATSGGTMWIYSGASPAGGYSANPSTNFNPVCLKADGTPVGWQVKNKAKSRNNTYTGATVSALGDTTIADTNANNLPRWGWAWLLNRRVFYNNNEIKAEQSDTFVSPGLVSLMFTENAAPHSGLADWSQVYRKYKTFKDVPQPVLAADKTSPHFIGTAPNKFSLAGRFPGHTEPTESPRDDLVSTWGHNRSSDGTALYWTGTNPTVPGTVAQFPLVLTSIRCVEHFQGGPTTRNNSWNVEAEPVPWIEINSADARAAVDADGNPAPISDGDWVNVTTARSNSTSDQMGTRSPNSGTTWARGFKARVGVGMASNQRVAEGVVAIPWHWGDKGLSTGSRANDLCIDAWDANTMIPEYKACLCKISKIVE
ncbi:MAG TPA: molybdopterin-dependent oxidoreductase [Coriobacteriia bacterium]